MMARSGGFNVPADYFKSAMPVPVPATPPALRAKNPWPLYAGIASVVAAVSIVVGIFAYGQYSTASPSPSNTPPPPSSTPAPLPVASLDAPPASTSAAPKPPGVKTVLVVASPIDAIVFLGDTKLGVAPREVDVPEGKTVQVTVRADGYHDQVVTLDGSEGRKDVILRPKGSGARQPPATTKTADTSPPPTVKPPPTKPPSTSTGGGEIVNPWAH
jgi:serine/threonine-protein kinase